MISTLRRTLENMDICQQRTVAISQGWISIIFTSPGDMFINLGHSSLTSRESMAWISISILLTFCGKFSPPPSVTQNCANFWKLPAYKNLKIFIYLFIFLFSFINHM